MGTVFLWSNRQPDQRPPERACGPGVRTAGPGSGRRPSSGAVQVCSQCCLLLAAPTPAQCALGENVPRDTVTVSLPSRHASSDLHCSKAPPGGAGWTWMGLTAAATPVRARERRRLLSLCARWSEGPAPRASPFPLAQGTTPGTARRK